MVSKYSNVTPSAGAEIRRESQAQQNKSSGALTSWVSVFMAAAAGAAMANNYVMHPVLPDVADSLGVSISATGILAGAIQAGYLLGIIFLVPLGDIFNLKKVIIIQQITLSMVLLLSALSPSFVMLASALFLVGLMSSSSLQISSLGFRASPAGSRGATMGAIMAGISSGIVLSRIVSGALSEQYGWRIMLATLAAMTALIAIISLKALPNWGSDERTSDSYWGLIKSLPDIFIKHASLRASVVAGCCWFFVFSMLWVSLSVYLANEFSLSSTGIGLVGFAGLAGVLIVTPFYLFLILYQSRWNMLLLVTNMEQHTYDVHNKTFELAEVTPFQDAYSGAAVTPTTTIRPARNEYLSTFQELYTVELLYERTKNCRFFCLDWY